MTDEKPPARITPAWLADEIEKYRVQLASVRVELKPLTKDHHGASSAVARKLEKMADVIDGVARTVQLHIREHAKPSAPY